MLTRTALIRTALVCACFGIFDVGPNWPKEPLADAGERHFCTLVISNAASRATGARWLGAVESAGVTGSGYR